LVANGESSAVATDAMRYGWCYDLVRLGKYVYLQCSWLQAK